MARGRNYYDPIIQIPSTVEGAPDLSRIELFPAGAESLGRLPQDQGKWIGRRINPDGSIAEEAPGDFDHDKALTQAQDLWPGLTVYELNAENLDSTWEGVGPSPRIWQTGLVDHRGGVQPDRGTVILKDYPQSEDEIPPAVEDGEQMAVRLLAAPVAGSYILIEDMRSLLEAWAVSYDDSRNPSGAAALREACEVLKEIG